MAISFKNRKRELNKKNKEINNLRERWDEVDREAAARGAAILINNGSADFGKVNYSFTADKDVEEFEKQVSVQTELIDKLYNDPKMQKASEELNTLLDAMPEPDLDDDEFEKIADIFDDEFADIFYDDEE